MVTTKVSLQKVFQSEKANIKVLPPTKKKTEFILKIIFHRKEFIFAFHYGGG